ncbi:MAG: L,D-transpeptidase family protein [Woeseiaceae bacterium]
MIITLKTTRHAVMLLPLALLGGCTTFNDYWADMNSTSEPEPEPVPVIPVEERPVEEPIPANHFELTSPEQSVVGVPQVVLARDEDTFSDLARAYGLGYDELVAANPDVNPWLPGADTPILLPTQFVLPSTAREGVVLNIATKRLFYYPKMPDGQNKVVKTYPIGIGRVGWETPLGSTTVTAKAVDPVWYVPQSVRKEHAEMGDPLPSVIPAGPDNPLGSRVLKLDIPGYLIHGTNQPYGVGMRVSHGCVRLYPENIEYLYDLVEIGESVQIINEPYLLGKLDGELMFEAHEPLEDDAVGPDDRLNDLFVQFGESAENELTVEIESSIRELAGIANGAPLRVSARGSQDAMDHARRVRNVVETDPDAPTLSEVREMIDDAVEEGDQT